MLSKPNLARLGLCVLSGTLLFLSCASFDIWPLTWFGLVPLLYVVLDEKCERPFLWGWIAGVVANGGGFYWINNLLVRFGHMPWIAALPLYFLLIGYQALAFGAFAWLLRRLKEQLPLRIVWLAPLVFVAVELVVPFMFPWYLAITQAWVRPVIQIADLTGPLGVTFLIVLINGAIYEAFIALRRSNPIPWRHVGAAVSILAAALIYGQVRIRQVEKRIAAAPKVEVGLVQANIGIDEKWDLDERDHNLAVHQRLSADLQSRGAQLIVWPESSYPYPISRNATNEYQNGYPIHGGFDAPVLFGALTRSRGQFPYNSALMLDSDGRFTGRFDKNYLLVFGEYIPYYEHFKWLRDLIPEMSNFARGTEVTTFPFGPYRLGPMICYEDIIPSFARRLVRQDPPPNLLVNITNDAWFGATSEPYEHMALAVYRAVEHRLDLVRAVNTGVSAFIDATGRVVAQSKAVDPDATPGGAAPAPLLVDVAMLEPSGPYGAAGDVFGGSVLLAVLALCAAALARAGRPVAWRDVLSATGIAAALTVGAGLVAMRGHPLEVLRTLAHLPQPVDDTAAAWGLFAGGALSCFVVGARFPRLEATTGLLAVVLAPTLLFGRTEGNTAALVFATLGVLAAVRITRTKFFQATFSRAHR